MLQYFSQGRHRVAGSGTTGVGGCPPEKKVRIFRLTGHVLALYSRKGGGFL